MLQVKRKVKSSSDTKLNEIKTEFYFEIFEMAVVVCLG
jgi:hypothetical protein